ncbi:DsbA family protein [Microbacterium sp. P05]|uniref:DsbA family protein n=1 Tax=Microbacterium sp. P05 TaxID=3366948 RepID=UPI003745E9FF
MAAGKTNWFAIWVSVAVVVIVVAVGGIVWWSNSQATAPGVAPQSSAINADTGAIAVGSGENTVDTYVDFMCPVCNQFEQVYGSTLEQVSSDGTATLNIHPIAILDSQSQGTQYSTRSANAMYCVAEEDPANSLPFLQAMYENQPEEGTAGLDDDAIISIAQSVGAGDAAASCIQSGTYEKYVTALTRDTPIQEGAGGISTPTIVVNGQTLSNSTDLTGDPQVDILARFS